MRNHHVEELLVAASLFALLAACSTKTSGSGSGGSSGSGGALQTGGTSGTGDTRSTGGAAGSGGGAGAGGTTGGAASSGGAAQTGGTAISSGTTSAGGTTGSGGINTGGASATGGGKSTGGATGTGASSATGGTNATGGAHSATGGNVATGGSVNTGGTPSGGTSSTGGTSASGGNKSTGGASNTGGSAATGGASNTGGSAATGGASNTGGSAATGAGGSTHTGPWRIMPFGDSITASTCYPQLLFKELNDKGRTNFIFVGGNVSNQICGTGVANTLCEGMGGEWATNLVSGGSHATDLQNWTSSTDKPDVVLMHFGTNDIWGTQPTQKILDAFSYIVDAWRAVVPNVIFFVAQIIPMNPADCTTCETRLEALNAAIPAWASGKSTASSPVYPVNVWSALSVATYVPSSTLTDDGVHPKPPAAQLMADAWYAALAAKGIP